MPYENQYIGVFLYSMGFISGRKNEAISDSVNLLQQTPADKTFNDLLLRLGGKNFIIEFKRSERDLNTEVKKPKRQKLLKEISDGNEKLKAQSRKSHFISYATIEGQSASLIFKPYASFQDPMEEKILFPAFISQLNNPTSGLGIADVLEFETYLRYLITNSSGSDISGIIVNVSAGGDVHFLTYSSYLELNKSIGLDKKMTQSLELKKNERKGPSLGMM